MSVVHYKFKNNLEYKTIKFDGLSISLGDLKRAIMAQNKTKSGEFDLEIKNAQTKEGRQDVWHVVMELGQPKRTTKLRNNVKTKKLTPNNGGHVA